MLEMRSKKNILDKLMAAREAIQQALQLGSPVARFDPTLLPSTAKSSLSQMEGHLDRMIQELREEQ